MAKDPAVLFYTSDFLTGTSFLTYEQKGQYITLLCQQHQLYRIPENHMISICGSNDSPVIKKFAVDSDGFYYNARMREEAERRANYCESRSNNKSGRPKSKGKKKIIRKSYDNHMETETETENKDINRVLNESEIFDFDTLFKYWEQNKKGTTYKPASRVRMLDKLKALTSNDVNYAKEAIFHAIDNNYQGFCNGNELYYKRNGCSPQKKSVFQRNLEKIERGEV